jgi:hypothetical protein
MLSRYNVARAPGDANRYVVISPFRVSAVTPPHRQTQIDFSRDDLQQRKSNGKIFIPLYDVPFAGTEWKQYCGRTTYV